MFFVVSARCLLLLRVIRCVLTVVLVFAVCCLTTVVCWLFDVRRCPFVVFVCLFCDVGCSWFGRCVVYCVLLCRV